MNQDANRQKAKKTIEQRRAIAAWDIVQEQKRQKDSADFKRQAKQLPVRIMTSGLGHAMAFLQQKGGDALAQAISKWVNGRIPGSAELSADLMQRIMREDSTFLRRATDESLAYLLWINRFAEIEIKTETLVGSN